jgi:hypothetical protein
MKRSSNKAGRSRQRAARKTFESLPGMTAVYADSLAHSMIEGSISVIRGRPNHVGAFGTIETMVRTPHDRPVVVDARKVIGAPERILRHDGRERCVVTLRCAGGRIACVGLDALCDSVEVALRKARR